MSVCEGNIGLFVTLAGVEERIPRFEDAVDEVLWWVNGF